MYLNLAFELYPREASEVILMGRKKEEWTKEEAMKYLIEQMGPERILHLTAEVMEKQPIDKQDRLIEALIEQIGPEKLESHLLARRKAASGPAVVTSP